MSELSFFMSELNIFKYDNKKSDFEADFLIKLLNDLLLNYKKMMYYLLSYNFT